MREERGRIACTVPPVRAGSRRAAAVARFLVALAAAWTCWASAPAVANQATIHDARVTSTARLLAGTNPDYEPHARVAALDAWQAHRDALAPQWERLRRERLGVIANWRDEVLGPDLARCRTLLYPFSGPDFLNADLLFPRCDTYVFFGLEQPGTVPALENMGRDETALFLKDVRFALGDLLERNYFITSHMSRQLHTPRLKGVLPVMLASMALLDVRITAIEPFDLRPTPPLNPSPDVGGYSARRMQAIKVEFFHPQVGKPQTLYYFSLDATDVALRRNPEFLPFLAQFRQSITFIKAGSYLLHGPEFAGTRKVLLDVTALLVQDDTGIPYRMLRERGWEVRLFGRYARPVQDFNYGYQEDLAAAYRAAGKAEELPFSFGYHWQQGRSGLMIARSGTKGS